MSCATCTEVSTTTIFFFRCAMETYFGELRYRCDIIFRITDALDKDRLRLVINGGGEFCGAVAIDELDTNAIFLEGDCREGCQRFVERGRFETPLN